MFRLAKRECVHALRIGVNTELLPQSMGFWQGKIEFLRQLRCGEVEPFLKVYLADCCSLSWIVCRDEAHRHALSRLLREADADGNAGTGDLSIKAAEPGKHIPPKHAASDGFFYAVNIRFADIHPLNHVGLHCQ
jgi:hypothetical protein